MSAHLAQIERPFEPHRDVAVFDLDGTLTRRDTLFAFLRFAVGDARFFFKLPLALLVLAAMALRLVSRERAKELVLALYLRGRTRDELAAAGHAFARERLPALLRPQAKERLDWHAARRHRCVVATASLALYVEPWARGAGFADVLATALAFDGEGRFTGRLAGGNCQGTHKLERLERLLGNLSNLSVHGYGDSPGDRPFLEKCSQASYRPFRERCNRPSDLLRLMRPHQWTKNAFVFVGVLFGHAWREVAYVQAALLAAGAFSLVASAIYIVNDYCDRERDRVHPTKRARPLAAGRVSVPAAMALALVLAAGGFGLAAAAGPVVLGLVAAYAALNLAYSFGLKSVVILDVFAIAAGFILRILAGTLGIGVPPSQWLLVCSLFLTLFLGFTKRRAELLSIGADFVIHRKALLHYNPALLDKMTAICAAGALLSYSLYTMSPATIRIHGTENLIYTIPLVVYGLFRYLHLLHSRQAGVDASHDLGRDPHIVATLLAWAGLTAWLITQ